MHPGIGGVTSCLLTVEVCNGLSKRTSPSAGRLKAADLSRGGLSFYWRDAGEAEEGASDRGQEE